MFLDMVDYSYMNLAGEFLFGSLLMLPVAFSLTLTSAVIYGVIVRTQSPNSFPALAQVFRRDLMLVSDGRQCVSLSGT